jgi:hypothetical protein
MELFAYKVSQIFKIKSLLGYFFINIFQDVKKVDENLHYFGFCAIIICKFYNFKFYGQKGVFTENLNSIRADSRSCMMTQDFG